MVSNEKFSTRWMFPKEHGGWAILFVPALVALGVMRAFDARAALFLVLIFFVFLLRLPAYQFLQKFLLKQNIPLSGIDARRLWRCLFVYSFLSGLLFATLVFYFQGIVLLEAGAIGAAMFLLFFLVMLKRIDRTRLGEILGIFNLTFVAAAASWWLRGRFDALAASLWTVNFLFFASRVFYVNAKIRLLAAKHPAERDRRWRRFKFFADALLVYVPVFATLALMAKLDFAPWAALAAFVPVFLYTLFELLFSQGVLRLKKVGMIELLHSAVFAILLILAWPAMGRV